MTGILLLIVGYLHTSVFFKKAVVNYCAELLTGALAKESRLTDVDLPTFICLWQQGKASEGEMGLRACGCHRLCKM